MQLGKDIYEHNSYLGHLQMGHSTLFAKEWENTLKYYHYTKYVNWY